MAKHYRDYILKDGKFIGDFETMYRECEDPWKQSSGRDYRSEIAVTLNLLKKHGCRAVVELGCGKGIFTQKIHAAGIPVTGVDIAPTAIRMARSLSPQIPFEVADILDFDLLKRLSPDCILMADVTWYVLDKLDAFLDFYRSLENVRLLHILVTYPPGVQKYGTDKFTTLDEILRYFNLNYEEFGSVSYAENRGHFHTWFMALGPRRETGDTPGLFHDP